MQVLVKLQMFRQSAELERLGNNLLGILPAKIVHKFTATA